MLGVGSALGAGADGAGVKGAVLGAGVGIDEPVGAAIVAVPVTFTLPVAVPPQPQELTTVPQVEQDDCVQVP